MRIVTSQIQVFLDHPKDGVATFTISFVYSNFEILLVELIESKPNLVLANESEVDVFAS